MSDTQGGNNMKKLLKVLPVMFVLSLVLTNVFAINIDNSLLHGGTPSDTVKGLAQNVWSTISVVCYILAIAAVVFAGLRYMFASADQKADIKKSIGILIIGAVLVFGAGVIIQVINNISSETITAIAELIKVA